MDQPPYGAPFWIALSPPSVSSYNKISSPSSYPPPYHPLEQIRLALDGVVGLGQEFCPFVGLAAID